MYENVRSIVCVGCKLSEEFSVKVGVHQGSCLNPMLFITVLEAFSQEFSTGCPLNNLYVDNLVFLWTVLFVLACLRQQGCGSAHGYREVGIDSSGY